MALIVQDTFDGTGLPANYTESEAGAWDQASGVLYADQNPTPIAIARRDIGTTQQEVIATYKTGTQAMGSIGGLLLRCSEDFTKYVSFELVKTEDGTSPTGLAESKVALFRKNGLDEEDLEDFNLVLAYETTYTIKARWAGNIIACYVDDVEVFTTRHTVEGYTDTGAGAINFRGAANYLDLTYNSIRAASKNDSIYAELAAGGYTNGSILDRERARLLAETSGSRSDTKYSLQDLYVLAGETPRLV